VDIKFLLQEFINGRVKREWIPRRLSNPKFSVKIKTAWAIEI
jgi:hypothetical protein